MAVRPAADETLEPLGPYTFIQKKAGYRVTEDSFLLAEFLPQPGEKDTVVDLGTGSGVMLLLLAWKTGVERVVGVEAEGEAAETARGNVRANGLGSRVEIVEMDWRMAPSVYPEGSFSVVVSNPPYVKSGAGRVSPHPGRAAARTEIMGGLDELVRVSAHLAG
ncbi:MAG: methyltransferase, partial [Thermodesulfobacteriota bacterium]